MARIVEIADAVVYELNQPRFSRPLVAARHYYPRFSLSEMDALHISVVPRSVSSRRLSRDTFEHDYVLDVAIQKRIALETEIIDDLMSLVEEIVAFFRENHLTQMPELVCMSVQNDPIYAIEHLEEWRQFTSVVTLTYR